MRPKLIIYLVTTMSHIFCYGQGWIPLGSRSQSICNASVALSDSWSYHHNPGSVAALSESSLGIAYENRFLLKELQSQGVSFVQPLKTGVLSVGGQFFGHRQFRTNRLGVGYGLKLTSNLYAGVQINYLGVKLPAYYGEKHTATAEAGFLLALSSDLDFGCSVFNLGRTKLSDYQDDRLSTVLRSGFAYRPSTVFTVLFEAEKHVDYHLRLKSGMEYEPMSDFFIRLGVASKPIEFSFGIGYVYKAFQLDVGSSYDQLLGWNPNFSLHYTFKKN